MAIDTTFNHARQQELTGTSDVVSTDVYDAGSAKRLFAGAPAIKGCVQVTASGGTNPTFRARFVGADNAGLTTNPEIIADTGVSAALAAADIPALYELAIGHQKADKRYYGWIFTQGGTSPTATVNAFLADLAQSNTVRP